MELATPSKTAWKIPGQVDISLAICYITFQTRFSFKQQRKGVAHRLAPGTAGVEGGFVGVINVIAGWKQQETEKDRVHLCNVCDKDFKSLPRHNQQKIWQHIGHVGCGKKFHTNSSTHRHKKLLQLYWKSILVVKKKCITSIFYVQIIFKFWVCMLGLKRQTYLEFSYKQSHSSSSSHSNYFFLRFQLERKC